MPKRAAANTARINMTKAPKKKLARIFFDDLSIAKSLGFAAASLNDTCREPLVGTVICTTTSRQLSAPHCGSLRSGRTRGTHPGHAKSPGITRRGSWRRFGLQRGSLPDGPDLEPKISAQTHMVCELPHNPSKKGAC